jgi:hypothetical protein
MRRLCRVSEAGRGVVLRVGAVAGPGVATGRA